MAMQFITGSKWEGEDGHVKNFKDLLEIWLRDNYNNVGIFSC
jgi:hypothetical protein